MWRRFFATRAAGSCPPPGPETPSSLRCRIRAHSETLRVSAEIATHGPAVHDLNPAPLTSWRRVWQQGPFPQEQVSRCSSLELVCLFWVFGFALPNGGLAAELRKKVIPRNDDGRRGIWRKLVSKETEKATHRGSALLFFLWTLIFSCPDCLSRLEARRM